MFEPEFLELFTQRVRIQSFTGRNEYGEETYSSSFVELPTHLVPKSESVTTQGGEVVWVAGTMYTEVTAGLDTSDKYEVESYDQPGSWFEVDVVSIQVRYDEDGPHHMVLYYGEK